MFRSLLLLGAATSALLSTPAFAQQSTESVTVTAEKLAAARNAIQTQTGASTYTITAKDIQAQYLEPYVVGGDRYHVTVGAGLVVRLPRDADLSAEVMPLGERSASLGFTWRL